MREDIVVVGTSFRRIGFERLGTYVLPTGGAPALHRLRAACAARELVYVATCNRVEIYLAGSTLRPRQLSAVVADVSARTAGRPAASEDLFVLTGTAALEHLFSVVASLDSLVLGECEIAGQVRRAAEAAVAAGLAGPTLERAFRQATRVARRVRAETAIGRTPVSVASLALQRIRDHFHGAPPRDVVLVGVGDVTKKVAAALQAKESRLLFVNRTESRAAELAARHGGVAMSLERFRAAPPAAIDLIVTATRAPGPVIEAATLLPALAQPRSARLLVCDLGVPADVDPAVAALPDVRLLTLPDLEATARENRARLEGEVERVRAIVAGETHRFAAEMRSRALAAESVDAVLAGRLAHLAPDDRELLRRFVTSLAERLARQPAVTPEAA
jgi:glutamyl-tRNA reductase